MNKITVNVESFLGMFVNKISMSNRLISACFLHKFPFPLPVFCFSRCPLFGGSNSEAIQYYNAEADYGWMSQEMLCKDQVSSKSVRVRNFCVDLTWNDPHPKRDCHHTYAHPENRSFIHRFALICSAIIIYHGAEADVRHWQVYIMLFVFLEVLCVSPLSKVGLNHESCGRMDG